jgi:hypothetical protein
LADLPAEFLDELSAIHRSGGLSSSVTALKHGTSSALHHAAQRGRRDVLEYLIRSGPDAKNHLTSTDSLGRSVADVARIAGFASLERWWLEVLAFHQLTHRHLPPRLQSDASLAPFVRRHSLPWDHHSSEASPSGRTRFHTTPGAQYDREFLTSSRRPSDVSSSSQQHLPIVSSLERRPSLPLVLDSPSSSLLLPSPHSLSRNNRVSVALDLHASRSEMFGGHSTRQPMSEPQRARIATCLPLDNLPPSGDVTPRSRLDSTSNTIVYAGTFDSSDPLSHQRRLSPMLSDHVDRASFPFASWNSRLPTESGSQNLEPSDIPRPDVSSVPEPYQQILLQIESRGWRSVNWKKEYTMLHWAASKGHGPLCRYLVHLGGDPQGRDERGRSPADLARKEGHSEVVEILDQMYF